MFVSNITHFKKNSAAYHKCTLVFMQSARCFCYILLKFEFFSTYFRNTLKYKKSWKSDQWAPSRSIRTDWRADVAFRNFANACDRTGL